MLEKRNYKHNLQFDPGDGFINGQGAGDVAKMKYGFYRMAWNGCEMIALYNAAHALGKHESLADICLEMYPKSSVACGFSAPILCCSTAISKAMISRLKRRMTTTRFSTH